MKKSETKPLVDKNYLLEKFPGKGGWTFARVPEVLHDKHAHFGWVRVRGHIDGVEINHYHLMPMGNGSLFLPVKAEIRKKIKKQAGDFVHVVLYADNAPFETPEDLKLCLDEEPGALHFYNSLVDGEKKLYADWINSAKKEETRIDRLSQTLNSLRDGKKFRDH
ncbi:MAG: DUF1905 domain-containing protein [Bacteroidetes bacterium]|nr:DUF1905 domain-containing protein [Bacteroidota bacterium]